jgi:glycerophosphoryl diester phosphodiesterase
MKLDLSQRKLLFGHRGVPLLRQENTLDGFKEALETGLDGFECDLQQTSDGVLVFNHDFLLRDEPISSMTWSTAKRKASWLLRLEEVLEFIRDYPRAFLNLELKTRFPQVDGREGRLISALRACDPAVLQRTWVSSFDPAALVRLRAGSVPVALGLIVNEAAVLELLPALPVEVVHLREPLVDKDAIDRHHADGRHVFTWLINDRELGRRHLEWGADGIVGDDHRELLAARQG